MNEIIINLQILLLLPTDSTASKYGALPAEGKARDDALVVGQLGQEVPVGNIPDQNTSVTGSRSQEPAAR